MSDRMDFRLEWCHNDASDRQAGKALWALAINDQLATELEDLSTEAVRTRVVAPMELLGEWLAHNWWRLRWEPEQLHSNHDWRMSHSLPAIGGGMAWPNLSFSSDGDYIQCRCVPTERSNDSGMPVRYLSRFEETITAGEFERSIDCFMERLSKRLRSSKYRQDVVALWQEVNAERRDPVAFIWRRLEALLGYDVDAGPEILLSSLIERFDSLGKEAVNEVAAVGRSNTLAVLETLEAMAASGAHGERPPDERKIRDCISNIPRNQPIWRRAAMAADMARRQWGLGSGPISDSQLLELFALPKQVLEDSSIEGVEQPVAMRTEQGLKIVLNRKRVTGKRFALARVLADELYAPLEDKLLPVTDSKTARQRFQRAFAQEFLCPFSSLEEALGERHVNEEFIEDMAEHYRVSPQTVSYLLQNRGVWHAA
ncbi:hypothetical protein HOP58_14630 [Halomonas sp. MCCC 1A11062]|nr:hypothetical protein [Halomonas sp. MCCC 1A11062]